MNTNKGHILDSVKLEYQEMEFKIMGKSKTAKTAKTIKTTKTSAVKRKETLKVSLKVRILALIKLIRVRFDNIVKKIKNPSKKTKKVTKEQQKLAKQQRNHVIMGIGLLLVVVSIAYSTSVIFIGVSSTASKIALFPQALFALLILLKAFSKIYK